MSENTENTVITSTQEDSIKEKEKDEELKNYGQIIDEDENFWNDFGKFLRQFNFDSLGYYIVSTFGPQSTGKSTLLNLLFGTEFPTMDGNYGRYKCTRGIYCSSPRNFKNILCFDLEGSDSNQRGDDKSFERKISIFALAVSEILIVNSLMTDIGRYVGNNMALLQTCFQLNIQLFQTMKKDRKTLLLFTIRDYEPTTNFSALKGQIMKDIEDCWSKVIKPPKFQESELNEFFDIKFVALPNFHHKKENFHRKVEDMKLMFQAESSSFLYKKDKYSHYIPIHDLHQYLGNIWNIIKENKDVDIPTQRKMLAMFRCDEISNEIVAAICEGSFNKWKKKITEKKLEIPELGKKGHEIIMQNMDEFDRATELYLPNVVSEKRKVLDTKIREKFRDVLSEQLKLMEVRAMLLYKKLLEKRLSKVDRIIFFKKFCSDTNKNVLAFFKRGSKACFLPDEIEYNEEKMKETEIRLVEEVEKHLELLREKQIVLMIDHYKKLFGDAFEKMMKRIAKNPKDDFWERARRNMASLLSKDGTGTVRGKEEGNVTLSSEEFNFRNEIVDGFGCGKSEQEKLIGGMRSFIFNCGVTFIEKQVKYLPSEMIRVFENNFPTMLNVSSGRELLKKYQRGRTAGLRVLNLCFIHRFAFVGETNEALIHKLQRGKMIEEEIISKEDEISNAKLEQEYYRALDSLSIGFPENIDGSPSTNLEIDYPDFSSSSMEVIDHPKKRVILDEDKVLMIFKDFQHRIDLKYIQTKNLDNKYNIPLWFWLVLLGLGANEIWYVITHPLLLILLLVGFVLFGWGYFKSYVRSGLENDDFNVYIAFGLRQLIKNFPQIFGENFIQEEGEEEIEGEDGEIEGLNDAKSTPEGNGKNDDSDEDKNGSIRRRKY